MANKESELYLPIKRFFEEKGYAVQGEVKECDIVLTREEELIIIEMKLRFNLELLMQAVDRQTISDTVYLAIPRPQKVGTDKYKSMLQLVRRLDLGLIFVAFDSPLQSVEIVRIPSATKSAVTAKGKRRKESIAKEMSSRQFDISVGGVAGEKIPTAYREQSIQILCTLDLLETSSPTKLHKCYGCSEKAQSILGPNFYKWFQRVDRGIYGISQKGRDFLTEGEFRAIVAYYKQDATKKIQEHQKSTLV